MPDGGWLVLDKKALRLLDAAGTERAKFAVRAKHLDTRSHKDGAMAVIIDANTQRALPFIVNLSSGELQAQTAFPASAFSVEAACLYRDAQNIDQLFLIGKEGISEQWLMQGETRKLIRTLALPAHVAQCRSDDTSHTLFVSEEGMGVWAYRADAEAALTRTPVMLRKPFGKLNGAAAALSIVASGMVILDEPGSTLHFLQQKNGVWKAAGEMNTASAHGATQMTVRPSPAGVEIMLRDDAKKSWTIFTKAWSTRPPARTAIAIVEPSAQTEVMARQGDAADDPAIWIHPADSTRSRVLGTNKKQGLLVYDLNGKQLQLLESGRLNNVDVRQNVRFIESATQLSYDLAIATQRDENSLVLYAISAEGVVTETARFPTTFDKIYGFCLYQPQSGGLEAFVNDKDGRYQQYRISRQNQSFKSELVRSFKLGSQPEGCVADDKHDRLFIGEEKRGVWVTSADAAQAAELSLIMPVGRQLVADTEGMAIYFGEDADYLIVSSQGDHSYVVLDASPPYRYRGKFKVGYNIAAGIDGSSETDGIDVTSKNLGGVYGKGMLVVQDGYKRLPEGAQNFKYVAWESVMRALNLK